MPPTDQQTCTPPTSSATQPDYTKTIITMSSTTQRLIEEMKTFSLCIEHVATEAQGRGDVGTDLMTEQLSTIYIYPICYWIISS